MTPKDWILTLNAIQIVLRDSNRTEQIHVVEETTGRTRFGAVLQELRGTPEGRAFLSRRLEINRDQVDFEMLRRLPAATLGGAYIRHLDDNGLSADTQAALTRHVEDPDIAYLVRRFRQTHDVWHPLTGLGTVPWHEVVIHGLPSAVVFQWKPVNESRERGEPEYATASRTLSPFFAAFGSRQ